MSKVLIEAEEPCLRDTELLFHWRNSWAISYEMSRTFINRAVHGEAHFSRQKEEHAQNRTFLKCSVCDKGGGCMADAAQMVQDEVQEVFIFIRNRFLQAIQGQLGTTKPGQLGNDMTVYVWERTTMEEIWRGMYRGDRFISGIPARSKNQEKMVRARTTLLHKGDKIRRCPHTVHCVCVCMCVCLQLLLNPSQYLRLELCLNLPHP